MISAMFKAPADPLALPSSHARRSLCRSSSRTEMVTRSESAISASPSLGQSIWAGRTKAQRSRRRCECRAGLRSVEHEVEQEPPGRRRRRSRLGRCRCGLPRYGKSAGSGRGRRRLGIGKACRWRQVEAALAPAAGQPHRSERYGKDGHAAISELRLAHEPPLHRKPRAILPDRPPTPKDFEQAFAEPRYFAFSPSFASHFLA
jgi:hypothetical protein